MCYWRHCEVCVLRGCSDDITEIDGFEVFCLDSDGFVFKTKVFVNTVLSTTTASAIAVTANTIISLAIISFASLFNGRPAFPTIHLVRICISLQRQHIPDKQLNIYHRRKHLVSTILARLASRRRVLRIPDPDSQTQQKRRKTRLRRLTSLLQQWQAHYSHRKNARLYFHRRRKKRRLGASPSKRHFRDEFPVHALLAVSKGQIPGPPEIESQSEISCAGGVAGFCSPGVEWRVTFHA